MADSPIHAAADNFLQWKLTNPATPQEKAIVLYQQLLNFRKSNQHPSAFYDADLERLVWELEHL
jgi:hypothetical protein